MKPNVAPISALSERAALTLHEDRFFDPDPQVRRSARELFEETRTLPLVCPHGHVDPRLLAENKPFPEPGELLLVRDARPTVPARGSRTKGPCVGRVGSGGPGRRGGVGRDRRVPPPVEEHP